MLVDAHRGLKKMIIFLVPTHVYVLIKAIKQMKQDLKKSILNIISLPTIPCKSFFFTTIGQNIPTKGGIEQEEVQFPFRTFSMKFMILKKMNLAKGIFGGVQRFPSFCSLLLTLFFITKILVQATTTSYNLIKAILKHPKFSQENYFNISFLDIQKLESENDFRCFILSLVLFSDPSLHFQCSGKSSSWTSQRKPNGTFAVGI